MANVRTSCRLLLFSLTKYILLFPPLFALLPVAHAQMGINAPTGLPLRQDLEIYTRNGFIVQQKFIFTTADPNASINTLSCASPAPFISASAGILKDPGGDSNYPSSTTCSQAIVFPANNLGTEVVFEDLDTEAGQDLVTITDANGQSVSFSGTTLPAPFFVAGNYFSVRFQANSNSTVGRGFQLRWRGVTSDATTPTTPSTAFANALQFDANKGALLSGYQTTGAIQRAGPQSTALGINNTASGSSSFAMGFSNVASGDDSFAIGSSNTARRPSSGALGENNTASGNGSFALGNSNTASGDVSSALGYHNTASGYASSVLGAGGSTGGFQGAMFLADFTGTTAVVSTAANQLTARFSGGYRFVSAYDNTGATAGVVLAAGSNSWAAISDSTKKEHFQPLNHAEVLGKLGSLRLGSWNYKGQHDQRHYGPMAQDFFARFGHDGLGTIGCDTLLAGHDFTAITLAGVQALIKENQQLKAKLRQVENQAKQNTARLDALESLLLNRRERTAFRKRP